MSNDKPVSIDPRLQPPDHDQCTESKVMGRGAWPLIVLEAENEKLCLSLVERDRELAQARERMGVQRAEVEDLQEQVKTLLGLVAILKDRAKTAERKHETVVNALCPQCGRSQQPDGDCYGCEVDGLQEQVAALRAEAKRLEARTQGHRDAYHHVSHLIPSDASGAMTTEIKWIADHIARVEKLVAREQEARFLLRFSTMSGLDDVSIYEARRAAYLAGDAPGGNEIDAMAREKALRGALTRTENLLEISRVNLDEARWIVEHGNAAELSVDFVERWEMRRAAWLKRNEERSLCGKDPIR